MKKTVTFLTIAVVLLATSFILAKSLYENALKANSDYEITYNLTVNSGASATQVLKTLKSENIIKSALSARIYLKLHPTTIQAGEFELNSHMDIPTILKILENAEDETIWVTIPEGLRIDEVAAIWADKVEDITETEFEQIANKPYLGHDSAEGYLFPDTYNVDKDITAEEVFDLMTSTFEQKVENVEYETLILASIVEREARTNDERPIIAGILKKRLDTYGWLIQADATLLYEYKDWTKEITPEMKESNSPYNTYTNPDLPPTPICNPGLASIDAARSPKSTNYWFYIHGNDENHTVHYASTQEEHNANIYQYLY